MNIVAISGRLTKDPEMRMTQSGVAVTSFCVAVDRPGVKDKADFINCVAWRSTAEFVSKYFQKGDPIEIQGTITSRSYEDKNGNKRTSVEVVADRVMFTKGKKREAASSEYDDSQFQNQKAAQPQNVFPELDEDPEGLPF